MPKRHMFDQVIGDLGDWMTTTRQHLIEGLHDGDRAPFAAPLNNKQLLDTYEAQWFPGGVRDEAAIGKFIEERGEPAYARVLLELGRARRRDLDTTPPPTRPTAPAPAPEEGY